MKRLTLALLLSVAPAALNAEAEVCTQTAAPAADADKCGSCDRTEPVATQADDERCCGLAELAWIDAAEAYDATVITITESNQTMSADGWNFVTELLAATFGAPTTQTNNELSYTFQRGEMDIVQWFETLAEVEAKFLAVQSTIENNPNCVGGALNLTLG